MIKDKNAAAGTATINLRSQYPKRYNAPRLRGIGKSLLRNDFSTIMYVTRSKNSMAYVTAIPVMSTATSRLAMAAYYTVRLVYSTAS